ncbi:Uma2 family endonuclease [Candidatus Parabeggiatoa sp. HSG14]|uniref:Uma2 family endonuclease n=1 Tax=Candidatus Parabeggiatoa sp. HSG14 TaxID=3055593 RepID=UPI0025A7A165|nr:Uma2 family endonuclease [Thiotrichales bacterium HSG14]
MTQALGNTELKAKTAYSPFSIPSSYSPPAERLVSEAEYWEKYYDYPDKTYEWNNGLLEEKAVSEFSTILMSDWFSELLGYFLKTHPIAKKTFLEMGFKFTSSQKGKVRRPDLGIILNSNPVPVLLADRSYQGIYDICIEAISDSTQKDITRDISDKKREYAAAGVKEYYILDGQARYTKYYRLNTSGIYVPIKPLKGGIIKSKVLPDFQFRIDDLYNHPLPEEMIEDSVYQGFVLPGYTQEKRARKEAEQRAEQAQNEIQKERQRTEQAQHEIQKERQRAEQAQHEVQKERQRAEQAQHEVQKERQRAEQLAEKLRALGINPDEL